MVGASASSSHAQHLKFLARAPSDADLISREGSLGPRLVTEDFTEPVGFLLLPRPSLPLLLRLLYAAVDFFFGYPLWHLNPKYFDSDTKLEIFEGAVMDNMSLVLFAEVNMQRYMAVSGGAGVNNSTAGGVSARENARTDPSFSTSNFSLNSRRPSPLHPYKLKYDKEPLNFRLGPPDFYPQTPNCPEETLTKEYLQSGYKETVDGIEEAREIALSQIMYFSKPEVILKCKEAIRRRFRAINESRAQKRKDLFLSKDLQMKNFAKKWIEALSLHNKRLRSLADHVPHGYRRKSLFEVLISHNIPFLRATWFIKVTYLNQVRPVSSSVSSSTQDKAQFSRTELWTKDIVEYLQQLMDEYFSKDGSVAPVSIRDQPSPSLLSSSAHKIDSGVLTSDMEDPCLHSKWWYMVHLLHWNYSEGLLLPSVVIEWVLSQLQEKDSVEALEMLLPIVFEVIEVIALSQTYTRGLVDVSVRYINDLSYGVSRSTETSKKPSLLAAFIEVLRYLILTAPDIFVALDCFPLPACVLPDIYSAHKSLKLPDDMNHLQTGNQEAYLTYMSFGHVACCIQRRSSNLANIANPGFQGRGSAKVVQLLDKAFSVGDARLAYSALFEEFSDSVIEEKWMAEVSPSLRSSLKWIDEAKIIEPAFLNEVVQVYSNERRLLLHGSFSSHSSRLVKQNGSYGPFSLPNQKDHPSASKEGSSTVLMESSRNSNVTLCTTPPINAKVKDQFEEIKVLISTLLRFPYTCSSQIETQVDESPGSLKKIMGSSGIRYDSSEALPSCEDFRESKKQKISDERSLSQQAFPSNHSDDEDPWWVRKGPKSFESMKVEQSQKLTKHVSRGRQKSVRKMQSLSQLAAARIEGSQGASSSHVCDNRLNCLHHRSFVEGKVPREAARLKAMHLSDIGKSIKQLRLLERRSISIWLSTSIKQLIDRNEKDVSKPNNVNGSFSSAVDRTTRWKLGEEELSTILFTVGCEVAFMALTKDIGLAKQENHVIQVGEAFLLSSLQRYENVLVAADLLPELLSAVMQRTTSALTSNGRPSFPSTFAYARNLLKKYRDVASVIRWEKTFRDTGDRRLLLELDSSRAADGESGFSSAVPGGYGDLDEYVRQKIAGRFSRPAPSMKEIVQRHVEEAMHYFYGKERKPFSAANSKNSTEKWDDAYQVAHEIVTGLSDCIRQNGGTALEGDPAIVASAVSAIVGNVGPAVVKVPDFTSCNYQSLSSVVTSLNCVRYILYIHIISLCLFKESLGERLGQMFEVALAAEASSAISGSFSSVKSHRNAYQLSPESHEINSTHSNDVMNNSANIFGARAVKAIAAISALVVGVIVHGASSLERMVTVFKLREGLDVLQFIRSSRSSSNGISRPVSNFKLEHSAEVFAHWFRLLVGNCGTLCDGLVFEILGESYIIALSRMQRMLPLNLVLPPAYSMFAMVIWRPYIFNSNVAPREDIHLYQCLSSAISEVIQHQPFRDLCFQNTHTLYDLLVNDVGDYEFAAMLELHNPDKQLKIRAFVPLRARLFLNALVDGKMPPSTLTLEDGSLVSVSNEAITFSEMEQSLLNQLVHVLDTLQPAKFHWQWLELRLLLNEQALLEKIDTKDMSLRRLFDYFHQLLRILQFRK
ncbi:hypothetical protein HPP92_025394 [Vanilla planifolia]|uniref:Mediator complex subunit Med12 domain-containing protein n=1 Tax=Vanilla planifolia TaxID=51239 RepID=A0A835PHX8_VANPL|nr:hypothetical protein HPP92_025394 [Vanilla planifolia]